MKVLVKINKNKLSFCNKKRLNAEYKNMLNTNVIAHDEIVFSDSYVLENEGIVSSFLEGLIKIYHLDTLVFENNEIAGIFLPLVSKVKEISNVIFQDENKFSYKLAEIISKSYIKNISCSYIPQFIFEYLDKMNIKAESRNEILFFSEFMDKNDLKTYSSIYYKNVLNITLPLTNEDKNDFITFIKINKSLKEIMVNNVCQNDLKYILDILDEYNKKNIKITINNNSIDSKNIEFLKHLNDFGKKKNIKFTIKYSKDYIEKNLIKQTNNNILRICGILILFICCTCITYVVYDNYSSVMKTRDIKEKIDYIIDNNDPTQKIEEIENKTGQIVINEYLASMKEINEDTVAWLKVNNTDIDYAVVQANDNKFYLDHDIYKNDDKNGWIFMDFENNPNMLDDNIIIYGHNRYSNGVMFGSLNEVIKKEWYENEENHFIKFDTLFGSYVYEIFSISVIPVTNDYISVHFMSKESKLEFLEKSVNRSLYNFNVDVDENTKILTLSTCKNHVNRIVVQAKLLENF